MNVASVSVQSSNLLDSNNRSETLLNSSRKLCQGNTPRKEAQLTSRYNVRVKTQASGLIKRISNTLSRLKFLLRKLEPGVFDRRDRNFVAGSPS